MEKIIFHIDVNSAYLSWTAVELLKNGNTIDIREIPAIIGGDKESRHGVVLAKSIRAKQYGVRTGEPVVNARKKCPTLHMEAPDHDLYRRYSQRLMEFLRTYTTAIEQVSVDECYMDFTQIAWRYPSPVVAANEIKNKVYETFGFTVNVGISNNKLLAKMASDFQKPNLVHTLFPDEIEKKMWPLPVSELFMAGRASVEILNKLEIFTIGDLAKMDVSILELHLKKHGRMLWEFANGIGEEKLQVEDVAAKGIGNSTTLPQDVVKKEDAQKVLLELAKSVSRRLKKANQKAGMVSVEIRYYTFQNVSHQKQLQRATMEEGILYETACELFDELWNKEPVRLLGIRTSKLVDQEEPEQLSLFDIEIKEDMKKNVKKQKMASAMEEIQKRFGKSVIAKGRLPEKE